MSDVSCINSNDPLHRSETIAEYIGVSMATLEKWRFIGSGPAYIRVGRLVRYRQSDLDRWLQSQTVVGDAA